MFSKSRPVTLSNTRESFFDRFDKFLTSNAKSVLSQDELDSMSDEFFENFRRAQWPGRKIFHHDVYFDEDCSIVRSRDVKYWPKGNLKTKNGKLLDSVREALPIKTSKTCKFVGTSEMKCGSKPQQFVFDNPWFYKFCKKFPKYSKMTKDFKERIKVLGSWPSQVGEFQAMADSPTTKVNYEDILNALRSRVNKLKIPALATPKEEEAFVVKTNPKANPGFLSSVVCGTKHRTADKYLRPLAVSLFRETSKKVKSDVSLWSIGGRERFQKIEKNTKIRSRFLLMPEGPQKIFGLIYAQPFYKKITSLNKQFLETSEFLLGANFLYGNFNRFDDRLSKHLSVIEADARRHDQKALEEFMVVSFGMLRSCFPDSEIIDRHFLYFASGFIFKNVVTPGRFIYQISKGLPTGSPFTSIIVTFCQWLQVSVTLKSFFSKCDDFDVCVYGDDMLVGCPFGKEISSEKFKTQFKKKTNHELDPCLVLNSKSPDFNFRPTFLRTYSVGGFPARDFEDTLRSIRNVDPRVSLFEYQLRITGSLYVNPFNFEAFDMVLDFRTFLLKECIKIRGDPSGYLSDRASDRGTRISTTAALRNTIRTPAWFNEIGRPAIPWLERETSFGTNTLFFFDQPKDFLDYLGLPTVTIQEVLEDFKILKNTK